jgi:hypothetical protein
LHAAALATGDRSARRYPTRHRQGHTSLADRSNVDPATG